MMRPSRNTGRIRAFRSKGWDRRSFLKGNRRLGASAWIAPSADAWACPPTRSRRFTTSATPATLRAGRASPW